LPTARNSANQLAEEKMPDPFTKESVGAGNRAEWGFSTVEQFCVLQRRSLL
jgi:hypothetical protein